VEFFPQFLEPGRHFITVLLRSHTSGIRRLLHFLTVFVQSGEEENVLTAVAIIARQNISKYRCICVTDVRLVVHIIDRRGDVELAHC
jgi:hypothetical protein